MIGGDLFPRDFILTIDAPSNYCGALRIFGDQGDLKILRDITDNEDTLPLRHKINDLPEALPPSLYHAIRTFVLSHAIRIRRGQGREHHSMMINVSRFTDIQTRVKEIVHRYVEELRGAISVHFALPKAKALGNTCMRDLFETWHEEYSELDESWSDIQEYLKEAVSPISVIEVNGSRGAEPLDYNKKLWPNGRKLIAVGGLSLSRGITLEDLTVSYFLRNTQMYDTLLQMGRWFGYRGGYEEICRIWTTPEAQSWYEHVAEALDELRYEFTRMEHQKLTPKDFGLCVRSHPESLMVTARNKMRTGQKVTRQISLDGRLVETAVLRAKQNILEDHRRLLVKFIGEVSQLSDSGSVTREVLGKPLKGSYFWRGVPAELVKSFVQGFYNHPKNQLTESRPICNYLDLLFHDEGIDSCDCVIISPENSNSDLPPMKIGDLEIRKQKRTIQQVSTINGIETIELAKRRVASKGHEVAGLSEAEIESAQKDYHKSTDYPDRIYRPYRQRPLLMLHLLDVVCKDQGQSIMKEGVVAFGLSFPGEAGSRRPRHLVEYVVNTVWWKDAYGEVLEEEDEASDE
nr:Z1 domain-containing protein [Microbulbifer elongatus]